MSEITELKNQVEGLERLLVIYNRYSSIRPEIWTWEKLGGRKDSSDWGERHSTVTHEDLMVQNLEKESTSLYAKGTELAKSLGFPQLGGGSTTQSWLNQAKNQLQRAESEEKIKNEENQKKKQLLQIQSQINSINLKAVLIPDDGRNPNIKRMNTLSQKNAQINTKKLTEQAQQLTRQIELEEIMQKTQTISQIQIQDVTFNEQVNSGDFNETPITDINLSGGCSECSTTKDQIDPILEKEGYHTMPDGSLMKDTDMEKGNNMKMAGIAAVAVGLGYLILKNK